MQSNYQTAKRHLKNAADLVKSTHPTDKPRRNEFINDTADAIVKDTINCPRWDISDAKREQYTNWLQNYAASLHP